MKQNFKLNIKHSNTNFHINIKSNYFKNKNDIIFFGNPIYKNFDDINFSNVHNEIKNISGFFLILFKNQKQTFLINDCLGNFRCYYIKKGKKVYISDKFEQIIKYSKKKLNIEEYNIWKEKNYTLGDSTLFCDIKKIPPGSILKLNDNLKSKSYLTYLNDKMIKYKDHCKIVRNSLDESIKNKIDKKIILLFSGGIDSTALAKILQKNKANFEIVYLATFPNTFESEKGLKLAKIIAKLLKKKLIIIKVKWSLKDNYFAKIINLMMNDFHTSFVQFGGIKKIIQRFGKNICIMSGQSADSIFCYGASSNSNSHFIIRFLNILNIKVLHYVVKKLLEIKYKINLTLPQNDAERKLTFLFSFFYYPFRKSKLNIDKYLTKKVNLFCKHNENKNIQYMKLKIFGFLQGPDNQVLINAAKICNFYDIYLPFSNFKIISSTCLNQSKVKSLFCPKYEVKQFLGKKLINLINNFKYNNKKLIKIDNLQSKIKEKFIKKIYEIKK